MLGRTGALRAAAPAGSASAAETCKGANTAISASTAVEAERTMLCLVNLHRKANGLEPLAMEPKLREASRGHSEDMVSRGYFCHDYAPGCDGYTPGDPESTPSSRAKAKGYNGGVGENIAADSSSGVSSQSMFTQWKNSPGHNANMLGTSYYVFGMGFAVGYAPSGPGSGGATGTQMFGTQDTGATDTAADLIVDDSQQPPGDPGATRGRSGAGDDACADSREAKSAAVSALADAKKRVSKLKRKVKRKSGKAKRRAKRKLRAAKADRRAAQADKRAAKAAVAAHCGP